MKSFLLFSIAAILLLAQPGSLHIKSALAAYDAGELAAKNKRFPEAVTQFHKAIEIEPTFTDAFNGLIDACLHSGRRTDAAAAITQFLEIEPDVIRYRLLLGQILLEENQAERALAQFSFVLKADPVNAEALLGFAHAAQKAGMADRAAEALERGRKQYPLDARFKPASAHP